MATSDQSKPSKKKEPLKVEKPVEEELNTYSIFPQPTQNFMVHTQVCFSDSSVLKFGNTKEVLDKHLKVIGGKVYTRFPPEPNGWLSTHWTCQGYVC